MNYCLLAIDLDGTLLDSTGHIPPANIDAIKRAEDAGMLVVLCTSRGLNEAREVIDELNSMRPIVLAGGAMVVDPTTSQILHSAAIEPHLALQVVEHLNGGHDAVLVLLDPQATGYDYLVIGSELLTDNTRWWFERMGAVVRYVDEPAVDDMHHALRVCIVGPPQRMPVIRQSIEQCFGDKLFTQHFQAVGRDNEVLHLFEIFAQGVNKWSGLLWVAQMHNIDPRQIAAIGDDMNDLAMITSAACSIAMANAVETVRLTATHHTLTNDDCGVAHAIDQLLAGTW